MLDNLLSQANMCFYSLFIFMARFSVLCGQVRCFWIEETFDKVFHITAEKMFAAKNTPFITQSVNSLKSAVDFGYHATLIENKMRFCT